MKCSSIVDHFEGPETTKIHKFGKSTSSVLELEIERVNYYQKIINLILMSIKMLQNFYKFCAIKEVASIIT